MVQELQQVCHVLGTPQANEECERRPIRSLDTIRTHTHHTYISQQLHIHLYWLILAYGGVLVHCTKSKSICQQHSTRAYLGYKWTFRIGISPHSSVFERNCRSKCPDSQVGPVDAIAAPCVTTTLHSLSTTLAQSTTWVIEDMMTFASAAVLILNRAP